MSENPEGGVPDARLEAGESGNWPGVIGMIGLIVGALMFIDKLDDLVLLPLLQSEGWWQELLGAELTDLIFRWLPPVAWFVVAGLIGMTLGALLFAGSWRLRRGRRSGAALCRTWAWLALVWLAVEMGAVAWHLSKHAAELSRLVPGDWEGSAVLGLGLAMIILGAFPVFLLAWFSRPAIKTQLAGWPE